IRRAGPAPTARRTANSFCRTAARANNKLATLAQAISSTSPTTAIRMRNERENSRRSVESPRPTGVNSMLARSIACNRSGGLRTSPFLQGLFEEQIDGGARLFRTHAIFQPGDEVEHLMFLVMSPTPERRRRLFFQRQRHPQVRRPAHRRAEKLSWSDADDGVNRLA